MPQESTLEKPVRNRYRFDDKQHIHLLDGRPLIGTTTALNVLGKTLTWWASGLACETMGWRNPKKDSVEKIESSARESLEKIKEMGLEDYIRLLNTAYRAHSQTLKKKADAGTDMHSVLEDFIKSQISGVSVEDSKPSEQITDFVVWSEKNVKKFVFSEAHCFSESAWVGGVADFGYIDKQGKFVLGDFKSSKEAYFNHWVQAGGYHRQIEENGLYNADGSVLIARKDLPPIDYHAIFCAGKSLAEPFFNYDTARTRRAFEYCIRLYQEKLFFEKED